MAVGGKEASLERDNVTITADGGPTPTTTTDTTKATTEPINTEKKERHGFASLSPEERRKMAARGGRRVTPPRTADNQVSTTSPTDPIES